jgi:hypothetical protein
MGVQINEHIKLGKKDSTGTNQMINVLKTKFKWLSWKKYRFFSNAVLSCIL